MAKVLNGKRTTRAGSVYWYKDGQLHRDDGPAVEEVKGWTSWFHEGKLHRDDGADEPSAVHYTGHKQWWQDGRLHRVTGPAVVWPDGREEWYLHGRELSPEEVEQHKAKFALKERLEASLRRSESSSSFCHPNGLEESAGWAPQHCHNVHATNWPP